MKYRNLTLLASVFILLSSCGNAQSSSVQTSSSFSSSKSESKPSSESDVEPSSEKSVEESSSVLTSTSYSLDQMGKEVQKMYPNSLVCPTEESSFQDYPDGKSYNVKVSGLYIVYGEEMNYYVYDCRGETRYGDVNCFVSIQAKQKDVAVLDKCKMYLHECARYDVATEKYIDSINSGTIDEENLSKTRTGSTLSCKTVYYEIAAAKANYLYAMGQ